MMTEMRWGGKRNGIEWLLNWTVTFCCGIFDSLQADNEYCSIGWKAAVFDKFSDFTLCNTKTNKKHLMKTRACLGQAHNSNNYPP